MIGCPSPKTHRRGIATAPNGPHKSGRKRPMPISNAAEMATGVPNPPAPSKNVRN